MSIDYVYQGLEPLVKYIISEKSRTDSHRNSRSKFWQILNNLDTEFSFDHKRDIVGN